MSPQGCQRSHGRPGRSVRHFFPHHQCLTLVGALLALGCLVLLPALAQAAIVTWDGGGADNNWNTVANWVGDVAPGTADVATTNTCQTLFRRGSRLETASEGIHLVEKSDPHEFMRGIVQALVGCNHLRPKLVCHRQVDAVIVRQLRMVSQLDRVVQEALRWTDQFQLNMQQVTQRFLNAGGGEVAFEAQGVADFVEEEIGSRQQDVAGEVASSQRQGGLSIWLIEEPLQDDRGIDDGDHRASRILRSTATLSKPFSGWPKRLRSSSMWRAAFRITSRSLTREPISSSRLIFDEAILGTSYAGA